MITKTLLLNYAGSEQTLISLLQKQIQSVLLTEMNVNLFLMKSENLNVKSQNSLKSEGVKADGSYKNMAY